MKTIPVALLFLCTFVSLALGRAEEDVTNAAQAFYDGYIKVLNENEDQKKWILKSEGVTPAFKKAYMAYMEEPDADPIICGQDYPAAGFNASADLVKDDSATVRLSSRDPSFAHTFTAVFVLKGGKWLLAGTDDLKAK
jgi:hypothetical protein